MRTPLSEALAQEASDDQIVDFLGATTSSFQPSVQCGNKPKLIPDARGLIPLLSDECDISPDVRKQRARIQAPDSIEWN
jgi:hypothetical protein